MAMPVSLAIKGKLIIPQEKFSYGIICKDLPDDKKKDIFESLLKLFVKKWFSIQMDPFSLVTDSSCLFLQKAYEASSINGW